MPDVIVVGGGVIGLSVAWELARHNLSVRVLEQGLFGREASWAGAGMLPPANFDRARSPETQLRGATHQIWPQWSEDLRSLTGLDNEFRRCGGVEVRLEGHGSGQADLADEIKSLIEQGITIEAADVAEVRRLIPVLGPKVTSAYVMPDFCQVRNPRHLKALQLACSMKGVELVAGAPVCQIRAEGDRVQSVHTSADVHEAAEFVFASGAWSSELLGLLGIQLQIEPIKGQIVLLQTETLAFRQVIQIGREYLVPRSDGRILIGSTEERTGFDKSNTAGAIADLIRLAQDVVPSLAQARFERSWAGLRPYSRSGRPHIGRLPRFVNASIAAGHFREGLHLSPITAVLIRQLLLKQPLLVPDACRVFDL
jgi:glycine oxidase